jgi:hypothetical protein
MHTLYRVHANGTTFGDYLADDTQGARNACAMDAGYASEADMERQLERPSGLVAEPIPCVITLSCEVAKVQAGGFVYYAEFYVEPGAGFDADLYAQTFDLNRAEMDADSVKAAQDAAARLGADEVLMVGRVIQPKM